MTISERGTKHATSPPPRVAGDDAERRSAPPPGEPPPLCDASSGRPFILLGICVVMLMLALTASGASGGGGAVSTPKPFTHGAPPPFASSSSSSSSGGGGGGGGGICDDGEAAASGSPAAALSSTGASKSDISSTFSQIYETLNWGHEGEGSGAGSSLRATAGTRALIEMLVYRHRVRRFLDAPCGSSHWWPPLLARIRAFAPCFAYHGVDVVPSVIEANRAKFAGDAGVSFEAADISAAALPVGAFDMILCRDALQHIPLLDAIDVLQAFARAAPRVLAVGSYVDPAAGFAARHNRDIRVGEYYHISLLAPPFNMSAPDSAHRMGGGPAGRGEPVDILDELTPTEDAKEHKYLLLYTGEYLGSLDFDAMRAAAARDFGAVPRARAAAAAALAP